MINQLDGKKRPRQLSYKHGRFMIFLYRMVFPITLFVATLLPASARAEQPLVLGVHPFLASEDIYKRYNPLAEYLSIVLGRPVTLQLEHSYDEHVNSIRKGTMDIAFIGPAAYVKLTKLYGKVPVLAAFEVKGARTYKGVIVVREGSPIKTLAQLKGKTFAFGDSKSTMGHIVPRYLMLKAGVNITSLAAYDYMSNHDNVALGVLTGNFDAGALKDDILNSYKDKGLRVLASSQPLPEHLFVARSGLSAELVQKISTALHSLNKTDAGQQVLASMQKNLTALVPARDSDYDPIRNILDTLTKSGVAL